MGYRHGLERNCLRVIEFEAQTTRKDKPVNINTIGRREVDWPNLRIQTGVHEYTRILQTRSAVQRAFSFRKSMTSTATAPHAAKIAIIAPKLQSVPVGLEINPITISTAERPVAPRRTNRC